MDVPIYIYMGEDKDTLHQDLKGSGSIAPKDSDFKPKAIYGRLLVKGFNDSWVRKRKYFYGWQIEIVPDMIIDEE